MPNNDTNIVQVLQGLIKQSMESASLANVMFGTVVSVNPLQINVEQRFTITEEFLILTKNVKDYTTSVTVNWNTENTSLDLTHNHTIDSFQTNSGGTDNHSHNVNSMQTQNCNLNTTHQHSISGTKTITVHNALKQGDKVVLIRAQGGQKYVVLDKVG